MPRPLPPRRPLSTRHRALAVMLVLTGTLGAAACTQAPPVLPGQQSTGSPVPTVPTDARGQLAALVAAARDNRYTAAYQLTTRDRPARTVTVTVATDGSWLVTIPGGALGGQADVAIADTRAGLFECALNPTPQCVRIGGPAAGLPGRADPRLQHPFTDWISVMLDRQAAISVAAARPLPGARGTCFSIEGSSTSIAAPMDAGIFCYDPGGTLTAVKLAVGTLMLTGTPAPAPPTITLPGPVVPGGPLPLAAPPSPPPSSPSAIASTTHRP